MNEAAELVRKDFKRMRSRTVPCVNGGNAGIAYTLCKRAHFVIRACKQMKSADKREQIFSGKGFADFIYNIVRAAVRPAVENYKTSFRVKNKALFVDVVIGHERAVFHYIHTVGFAAGAESRGFVRNEKNAGRRREISFRKYHAIFEFFADRCRNASVTHLAVFKYIAGVTACPHIKGRVFYCIKKVLHTVGMIKMSVR